ncbi:MAG TPA: metallopeptidase TldD-related protein [Pilimelia sp.]|nr:metallopeptidase TldD-related protein [Pilimelia sp.]
MTAELDLAARVVELAATAAAGAEVEVHVGHTAQALTRFANSYIHQNVADAATTVRLRLHLAGRTATGATTVCAAHGLRALVERTVAATRLAPRDPLWPGLSPPALLGGPGTWDETTAAAGPADRADRVHAFVTAARGRETAGYCRTTYRAAAFANSAGQAVAARTSEASMDGVARVPGADGVARLASYRLADIDGAVLGERAAAKALAGADPIDLPPGRYEVVLEPPAVADILQNLAMFGFNGKAYAERRSFAELGADQFDPAVTLTDDPVGAGATGLPFDVEGTPRHTLTLVAAGQTRAVPHDRRSAALVGSTPTGHALEGSTVWGAQPTNLRLEPGPPDGQAHAAGPAVDPGAAPLVPAVRRGLLITDFWYTRVLDPKTLVVTGLTRNGAWLIEGGEVVGAVRNLRFTQSYPQALAPGAVLAVGATAPVMPDSWAAAWWAAPALRLASWHMTGNSTG